MSKAYKIKVNQGPGEATFVDIPQVDRNGKPLAVKAVHGGKYQLVDSSTGYAPENIRATRSGKNLQVFFEGRGQADLIIEDYYSVASEGFNGLIGEAESGRFYEYIPETAVGNSAVPLLADGSNQIGMALGGAEITPAGAAVGTLAVAAGLNPLLLAPLALLGGGGGGGGSGSDPGTGAGSQPDTTPPAIKSAQLLPADDTGPKDNVTSDTTPRIEVQTEPDAIVSVEVNGKTYSEKAGPSGVAVIQIPDGDKLDDKTYTPKVTATDKAGNKTTVDGTPFTIDTSADGPNLNAIVRILSITDDTGASSSDFYTNDTNLILRGEYKSFTPTGDLIKLELKNSLGVVVDTHYIKPEGAAGIAQNGDWSWDRTSKSALPEGKYELFATIVDKADNAFKHMNATAKQELTIDVVGPASNKGVSIVTMSVDSGVGSLNPLDGSRQDFKTNDTTPEFKGKLDTALNPDEWIEIQLLSKVDAKIIDSALIKADATNATNWTWVSTKVLVDGDYVVQARIVDRAGNAAVQPGTTTLVAPVKQDVLIDTKGSNDDKDSNKGLKITAINISEDTGAQDFVTSDGGDKDGIPNNPDNALSFNGQLNASFTKNGGKIFVQIVRANGQAVSSAYVEPTNTSWSYEHIGKLAEGQYVAKTILMDHVGNMISAKDQSFYVDVTAAPVTKSGDEKEDATAMVYSKYSLGKDEFGTYQFGEDGQIKTYTGGKLDLGTLKSEYAINEFSLKFWDQAGNLITYKNDKIWKFISQDISPSNEVGSFIAKDFTGKQIMGSVGQYQVSGNLDMASLYDGIDNIADQAAVNHVVLSNTSDVTLNLSMGDVLALGVTNSFSVANLDGAKHQGQIQMRVDGQSGDVLNLDGRVNASQFAWGGGKDSTNLQLDIGAEKYNVYSNASLGLVLFVDTDVTVNVL
jgi:hypothetical protein